MLFCSAQCKTYNAANLPSFSKEFATVVNDQVEKDGISR
jgi:hypothetical protein